MQFVCVTPDLTCCNGAAAPSRAANRRKVYATRARRPRRATTRQRCASSRARLRRPGARRRSAIQGGTCTHAHSSPVVLCRAPSAARPRGASAREGVRPPVLSRDYSCVRPSGKPICIKGCPDGATLRLARDVLRSGSDVRRDRVRQLQCNHGFVLREQLCQCNRRRTDPYRAELVDARPCGRSGRRRQPALGRTAVGVAGVPVLRRSPQSPRGATRWRRSPTLP